MVEVISESDEEGLFLLDPIIKECRTWADFCRAVLDIADKLPESRLPSFLESIDIGCILDQIAVFQKRVQETCQA